MKVFKSLLRCCILISNIQKTTNKKYIKFQTKFDDDATHTIEDDAEMVIINETKKLETAVY